MSSTKSTERQSAAPPAQGDAARVSLIVPVLNEEATIATFLEESGRALDQALAWKQMMLPVKNARGPRTWAALKACPGMALAAKWA